jgi:hypothetical protein
MKHNKRVLWFLTLVASTVLLSTSKGINAQERPIFPQEDVERARNAASQGVPPGPVLGCNGPITRVIDLGDENVRFTSANFLANPGGGEGGGFDKTPVLSTKVALAAGACLDAHLSAIVANGGATRTMFQVSLTFLPPFTPPLSGPRHMVGHFERPFGISSPAVFFGPERDPQMFAANFFQKVGTGPHETRPGTYRLDVWWAGAGAGQTTGAAFVLKLYLR